MNRFGRKLPDSAFAAAIAERSFIKRKGTVTKNQHRAFQSFENLSVKIAAIMYESPMRQIIARYFAASNAKKTIGSMAT